MMNSIYPNQDSENTEMTTPEAQGSKQDTLAELLSHVNHRISVLEQLLQAERTRQMEVPAEIWREGVGYADGNKVHMAPESLEEDEQIRSGSVVCSFGFIHHPWVRLRRDDRGVRVSGFRDRKSVV